MVEKLQQEFPVQVSWEPYYLRPDIPPEGIPMPERYRQYNQDPASPLRQRFAQAGLVMADRERIPSTRLAHQAAEFAREQGQQEAFEKALLVRYWERGEDLSAWAVLRAAAAEVGLDADTLQREVTAGTFEARVEQAVQEAYDLGITGIPTYVVANQYAITGAQEYPVFQALMRRLGLAPRTAAP